MGGWRGAKMDVGGKACVWDGEILRRMCVCVWGGGKWGWKGV